MLRRGFRLKQLVFKSEFYSFIQKESICASFEKYKEKKENEGISSVKKKRGKEERKAL